MTRKLEMAMLNPFLILERYCGKASKSSTERIKMFILEEKGETDSHSGEILRS